jgi:hypothetical protein
MNTNYQSPCLTFQSRDSSVGLATCYGLGGRGSVPGGGNILLYTTTSRSALVLAQSPIQWAPEMKWSGREGDHSPPSSAEVKNSELYLLSPVHFHGIVLNYLIKHRDNFTFTLYLI